MNNDSLDQIWNRQKKELPMPELRDIISKAGKQRRGQFLTISILAITVLILLVYGLYFSSTSWHDFTFGLFLMISSLLFRVILEFITLYRKENRLVALDNKAF